MTSIFVHLVVLHLQADEEVTPETNVMLLSWRNEARLGLDLQAQSRPGHRHALVAFIPWAQSHPGPVTP